MSHVFNADMIVNNFKDNFIVSTTNIYTNDDFTTALADYNETNSTFNIDIETIEKAVNSLQMSNVKDFNDLAVNQELLAHPVLLSLSKVRFIQCLKLAKFQQSLIILLK